MSEKFIVYCPFTEDLCNCPVNELVGAYEKEFAPDKLTESDLKSLIIAGTEAEANDAETISSLCVQNTPELKKKRLSILRKKILDQKRPFD